MDELVQVYNRDYAFARIEDLAIALWRGKTTPGAIALGNRMFHEQAKAYGSLCLLSVVEARAQLPGPEARVALADFLAGVGRNVRRSAVVLEADGFRGATMRALVSGLTLMARPQFPHKVFADVASAATFLAAGSRQEAPRVDAEEAFRAVRETRRHPAKAPHFAWMPQQRPERCMSRTDAP